jgi:hypothetical protein
MNDRRMTAALPSLILAVLAAGYVWTSYDYDPASRALPWIAGVLAMVLALFDVLATISGPPPGAAKEPAPAPPPARRELVAFAWIGAFLPLVIVLGFYAAIPLYLFCYLRLYARKNALGAALAAFGLAGFLYLVFGVFMGYEIFGGIVAGDYL